MDEPKVSKHHLFTKEEIREKLKQFMPEVTESCVRRVWKEMPVFLIDHELHKKIHGQKK
jgi:arginine repressor